MITPLKRLESLYFWFRTEKSGFSAAQNLSLVAPYPSIAITIILLHNFITRLLPQFLNEERVGLSDCPLEKPGDTAKSQTTCLYTALKQLDNYKFIKLMIKESVPKPSSCKHCKYYNYEGRRGGQCRLLNVPVRANWCACPLGVPITDILTTHSSSTPSTTRCGLLEDALPVKSSLLPAKILCCYTSDRLYSSKFNLNLNNKTPSSKEGVNINSLS